MRKGNTSALPGPPPEDQGPVDDLHEYVLPGAEGEGGVPVDPRRDVDQDPPTGGLHDLPLPLERQEITGEGLVSSVVISGDSYKI